MIHKTISELLSDDDGSIDSVLAALRELTDELRQGQMDDWENPTLDRFLDAMHAWLEATAPRAGPRPSWKFVELMIRSAKLYE